MKSVVAFSEVPLSQGFRARLIRPAVIGLAVSLALGFTSWASAGGKGVYLIVDSSDANDVQGLDEDYVKGIVWRTNWKAVEPAHNTFYWDDIGDVLISAKTAGKTVILQIDLIGGGTSGVLEEDVEDDSSLITPSWAWTYITNYVGGDRIINNPPPTPDVYLPKLPWYGDSGYQSLVHDLIVSLREYILDDEDRMDALEFIFINGWQANSDCPSLYETYASSMPDNGTAMKKIRTKLASFLDLDFNDVPILPDSAFQTAVEDIAADWKDVFVTSGSGIKLGVIVQPDLFACSADAIVANVATDNAFRLLTPNPAKTDLPGFSATDYRHLNRSYLAAAKTAGAAKVGTIGLGGLDDSASSAATWLTAIKESIGHQTPIAIPMSGCLAPPGDYYSALTTSNAPASNSSYLLVDYATEYWGESTYSCVTYFANYICKN